MLAYEVIGLLSYHNFHFHLQSASAIDNLATFYFNHITVGESLASPVALNVAQLISDCSGLFSGVS